jgi:hypothetical protein
MMNDGRKLILVSEISDQCDYDSDMFVEFCLEVNKVTTLITKVFGLTIGPLIVDCLFYH